MNSDVGSPIRKIKNSARKVGAVLIEEQGRYNIKLRNNQSSYALQVKPDSSGQETSLQGCELLCLALAACYGKDIRREAELRGIPVERIEVEVESRENSYSEKLAHIVYRARVAANASEEIVYTLMIHVDHVAEILNMLRMGTPVTLSKAEVITA